MPNTRATTVHEGKSPAGSPHAATARTTACPTSSAVPACARWAFTTTGQPAASADAVSPPATENAKGKLLDPEPPRAPTRSACAAGRAAAAVADQATPRRCAHRPTSRRARPRQTAATARRCAPARRRAARAAGPLLGVGPLEQCITQRLDLARDGFQQLGPRLRRTSAIILKRNRRRIQRRIHFGQRGLVKIRRERCARGGIDGAEDCAAGGAGLPARRLFPVRLDKI